MIGQRRIELTARLGQDERTDDVRMLLRHTEADMPAARMTEQVHRPHIQMPDQRRNILGMLSDFITVAAAIPLLGPEVAERQRQHPVMLSKDRHLCGPDALVAERAMYQQQRNGARLASFEAGKIVAVDVEAALTRRHCGLTSAP